MNNKMNTNFDNLIKKLQILTTIILLSIFFNLLPNLAKANTQDCTTDANGAIKVQATDDKPFTYNNSDYIHGSCGKTPDEYKITFYRVALCKEDPYLTDAAPDLSSCNDIFNNSNGSTVIVKPNEDSPLLGGGESVVMPIGTFNYVLMVADTKLGIKHVSKFVKSDGSAAGSIFGSSNTSIGSSAGDLTYCWTLEKTFLSNVHNTGAKNIETTSGTLGQNHGLTASTIDLDFDLGEANDENFTAMNCAGSAPSASDVGFNTTILENFDGDNYDGSGNLCCFVKSWDNGTEANIFAELGITGLSMKANLLKSDGTIASGITNSTRIAARYKYNEGVIISENTTGLKINIATTAAADMSISVDNSDKVWFKSIHAGPFTVVVQTKTKRSRGVWE